MVVVDDEGLAILGGAAHDAFTEGEGCAGVVLGHVVAGDDLEVVVFGVVEAEFAGGGSGEGDGAFKDVVEEFGEFEFTQDFVHGGAEGVEFLHTHAFGFEEAGVLNGNAGLASDRF